SPLLPFSFTPPPTPDIYTLSLHDALPICRRSSSVRLPTRSSRRRRAGRSRCSTNTSTNCKIPSRGISQASTAWGLQLVEVFVERSEEHTSELQSQSNLVCRLLLEKKKKTK